MLRSRLHPKRTTRLPQPKQSEATRNRQRPGEGALHCVALRCVAFLPVKREYGALSAAMRCTSQYTVRSAVAVAVAVPYRTRTSVNAMAMQGTTGFGRALRAVV